MLVSFVVPTQPAGSAGGLTVYKNGVQFAARARAYPIIHRSNARSNTLNLISRLSMDWETPLTSAQRIAWGAYAFNTPLTDAYSAPRYIKGYAQFMRSNRPRLQFGLDRIDDGPTTWGLPSYTLPVIVIGDDPTDVLVTVDPTDDWANQDDAAMLLWISNPLSPTRNLPPEVYQPLGMIAGSSAGIPAQYTLTSPYPWPADDTAIFIRSSVTLADGRLSGL